MFKGSLSGLNSLIDLGNPSDSRLGKYFDHLTKETTEQEMQSTLKFLVTMNSQAREGRTNG